MAFADGDTIKRTTFITSTNKHIITNSKSTTNLSRQPHLRQCHSFRVYKIPIHHYNTAKSSDNIKDLNKNVYRDKFYTRTTREYFKNYLYPNSQPQPQLQPHPQPKANINRSKSAVRCSCSANLGGTELPIRDIKSDKTITHSHQKLDKCTEIHHINIKNRIELPPYTTCPKNIEISYEIKTPIREIKKTPCTNQHVRYYINITRVRFVLNAPF